METEPAAMLPWAFYIDADLRTPRILIHADDHIKNIFMYLYNQRVLKSAQSAYIRVNIKAHHPPEHSAS
jgi:hypothetical protein